MKYINLSEGFNPFMQDDIKFKLFNFSGGEPHIKIETSLLYNEQDIGITHRIQSFNDVGVLLVAVDALRRLNPNRYIHLFLPYFPGARQDRIMVKGEPLTVKIYADIINSLKLSSVTIFDPHSDVTPALIDNCVVVSNHTFIHSVIQKIGSTPLLISPDAGSNKKIKDLQSYLGNTLDIEVVKCDKTRNTKTGAITGFEVYADNLNGRDCLIVDDICDGGGTFIGLAEELKRKGAGKIYLAVSHGIFSKGLRELAHSIHHIYTTDSFDNFDELDGFDIDGDAILVKDILTKIPLKELI